MNLRQLRYLQSIAEQGFNVSRAAAALYTSQSGVSKQIQLLEQEIGVEVLTRRGNRVLGLTGAGREVLTVARRMLEDAANVRRIGEEFAGQNNTLTVATTHTHARYLLCDVIQSFLHSHQGVRLVLRQDSPSRIARLVLSGEADIGISSEPPEPVEGLLMLPFAELHRSVITPRNHPLLAETRLTLHAIAQYPILTLDRSFVGGSAVLRAFEAAHIEPNIVFSAIDADVVKKYVELGLGIAILPSIAYERARDRNLRAVDAKTLFDPTIARIEICRDRYLRGAMLDFIGMLAPKWNRSAIERLSRAPSSGSGRRAGRRDGKPQGTGKSQAR